MTDMLRWDLSEMGITPFNYKVSNSIIEEGIKEDKRWKLEY